MTTHPYLDRVITARSMSKKEFYTMEEVATLLGVGRKQIQRLATKGILKALRTSPSKYEGVFADDLESYLAKVNGVVSPQSPATLSAAPAPALDPRIEEWSRFCPEQKDLEDLF